MKKLMLGIFSKHEDADKALFHLKDADFQTEEVSVIAREDRLGEYRSRKRGSTGEGAITGLALGGLAGLLIAATPVILPGLILVAGPLTVLSSVAMGAVTGGLLGALVDIGLSESQARSIEKSVQKGGVLLAVPVIDTNEEKARQIMEERNAEELTIIHYTEGVRKKMESGSFQYMGSAGGRSKKSAKKAGK